MIEDIRHEVMVNYMYQQQCAHLWVSDESGNIEGVLLRKSKNTYMACPPQLGTSAFAAACAALNVQVRGRYRFTMNGLTKPVCHDTKLSSDQDVPSMVP